MADLYTDAVAAAREQLEGSLSEMMGARTQAITAIGTALTRGTTDEVVVRELALVSAYMATNEHAFFDVASLFAEQVRERISAALRACADLSDGPNALLRWTLSSRIPRDRISEIDDLIERIRRARFSQNNLTETVREDLVEAAEAAADRLLLLLSRDTAADLPSLSELELLVELGLGCVALVARFLSLRADFSAQKFTDIALLRVLESAEVALSALSERVGAADRDVAAETDALATITSFETAVEALLSGITPFGVLLSARATTSPQDANLSGNVRLVPMAGRARDGRVTSAQVTAHPTDAALRRVTLPADATWNDSAAVEQELFVAHYENLWALGAFTPQVMVLARGTGTIAGDPYYPNVVVPDAATASAFLATTDEIDPFPDALSLLAWAPAGTFADKYAYVAGAADGLYYSDGTSWTALIPDADYRRNRFLLADGYPLGSKYPVETIRVYSDTAGLDLTLGSIQAGPVVSYPGSYEQSFGVLLNDHVSNAPLEVSWQVLNPVGITDRIRSQASGTWLQNLPASELVGQAVTVYQNETWTHRFITEVYLDGDFLELILDETISYSGTAYVFLPKIRGLNYPRSPFVVARPQDSTEVLDVRPGDLIVASVGGITESRPVLHCVGNLVLLAAPLHTHPDFSDEAGSFRRGVSDRASLEQESPFVYALARRYRGVSVGDRILPLAPPDGAAVGETTPVSGEAYSVRSLDPEGITVSPLSESADPLPRTYGRCVVWPSPNTDTDLFAVQAFSDESATWEDTGISDIERTARRLKSADDPSTQLDDVWPVRSVSFFVSGSPIDAERVGENLVRLSRTFPVYSEPVPAELRARLEEESRRGTISVPTPPTSALTLDAAHHYPLGATRRYLISSGEIAAGTDEASVLYGYALTGSIDGPVARGGAREYGWWAWVSYRLQQLLSSPPDFEELREDLGRAFSDLGAASLATYSAEFVEETSTSTNQVRVEFPADLPPNAAILAGTDFYVGATQTPIRVVSVDPDGATSAEDLLSTSRQALLTLTDRVLLTAGDPVSLIETTVSQAWIEFRKLVQFLDDVYEALGYLVPPEERVIADSASRLDAAGFPTAASAVRNAEFSKWVDSETMSARADLADTLNTLVSSLLSRRSSPLSG
jgi:hypothetical protein